MRIINAYNYTIGTIEDFSKEAYNTVVDWCEWYKTFTEFHIGMFLFITSVTFAVYVYTVSLILGYWGSPLQWKTLFMMILFYFCFEGFAPMFPDFVAYVESQQHNRDLKYLFKICFITRDPNLL